METKAKDKAKSKRLPKLTTSNTTLELLDFEQGVSLEIAPYQCKTCEAVFKRLSGFSIHYRYYTDTGKCPKDIDHERLNLRQVKHQANGNQYEVWELIPPTKPTGIKDELLEEMENRAFPKIVSTPIHQYYFDQRKKK
jgi:hypothetical protein